MHKTLTLVLLAATILTGPVLADEISAWRLFVGDHAAPEVTAIDLPSGEVLATIPLEGPAALYTTSSGEGVFAVQASANQVAAIRTGISIEDHGDHGDIEVTQPELINSIVSGERPVHFVSHDGKIALFFDGSGLIKVLGEHFWLDDGTIDSILYDSGAPHHGVAVPWGEYTLISVPNPADPTKLPIGINVLDDDGAMVGETHLCPDLHGEASSGDILAIACADGLLLVSGQGQPKIEKLEYSGLPEGKSTTMIGGSGLQYFLGNFGADKVVIIDPLDAEPYRLVDLPTRRVHFVTDPVRPRFAYVFTEDGQLRQLDVPKGEFVQSVTVTEPYSMDGDWSLARPRLAVAGEQIAVTDPNQGKIHLVNAETFEVDSVIELEGTPYNIVAVGGSGSVH